MTLSQRGCNNPNLFTSPWEKPHHGCSNHTHCCDILCEQTFHAFNSFFSGVSVMAHSSNVMCSVTFVLFPNTTKQWVRQDILLFPGFILLGCCCYVRLCQVNGNECARPAKTDNSCVKWPLLQTWQLIHDWLWQRHCASYVEPLVGHLPVVRLAASRGRAQAADLLVASKQAAAGNFSAVPGGAAVWGRFHSYVLSSVHHTRPGCKETE